MFVLVCVSIADQSPDDPGIQAALSSILAGLSHETLMPGCVIVKPSTQSAVNNLISDLISIEQAFDPDVRMAIFLCDSGNRWLVSSALGVSPNASTIAGRKPEFI